MTFIAVCRHAAHMESMALRAWARQGRHPLPRHTRIDYWSEWERSRKRSATTWGVAA